MAMNKQQPGTYYLTRGFIEKRVDPLSQFQEGVKKYGWDKCLRLMKKALSGYKRFALIDMGHAETEEDWVYTERSARLLGMEAARIQGTPELLEKMLSGRWDQDFLIVNKGEPITREMFGY